MNISSESNSLKENVHEFYAWAPSLRLGILSVTTRKIWACEEPISSRGMFLGYISPEQRVRKDHPLRPIRTMVDKVLKELSLEFNKMYSKVGRPSIPPEQLLRALLLQMLYSVRGKRVLVEEIDYNILFPCFVG